MAIFTNNNATVTNTSAAYRFLKTKNKARWFFAYLMLAFACLSSNTFSYANEHTKTDTNISTTYAIQVIAFKNPNLEYIEKLETLGEVNTLYSNGLTRVLLGEYNSLASAKSDLGRVKDAGYSDAFITRLQDVETQKQTFSTVSNGKKETKPAQLEVQAKHNNVTNKSYHNHDSHKHNSYNHDATHSHGDHSHPHLSSEITEKLNKLPPEKQAETVILDGKLYYKYGQAFVPVE